MLCLPYANLHTFCMCAIRFGEPIAGCRSVREFVYVLGLFMGRRTRLPWVAVATGDHPGPGHKSGPSNHHVPSASWVNTFNTRPTVTRRIHPFRPPPALSSRLMDVASNQFAGGDSFGVGAQISRSIVMDCLMEQSFR